MANFNSSLFFRRIKLYGFGLGLGLLLSYAFFGDRYPTWLPGSVIKEEIIKGTLTFSDKATCLMECENITKDAIDDLLENGDVNFGESDVRGGPCPSYVIEGETTDGRSLRLEFVKCDSIAELILASDINKKGDCNCP